ncbi:hypothetical protein [Sphingomonas hankyongi]|uniref:Uncharacterized protein n=1 Tax=Sphingomonas hankyongi TaxID=2908209 RepID=A0ABT0S007_9SPHN|nr:hypothetical protein [Sphingomonas hankyongi]MCL6729180.1 hypothetical protein [Sphingomonas hankyongi]
MKESNRADLIGSLVGMSRFALGLLAFWGGWMFLVGQEWWSWTDQATIHALAFGAGLFGSLYLKLHEDVWSKRLGEARRAENEARRESRRA